VQPLCKQQGPVEENEKLETLVFANSRAEYFPKDKDQRVSLQQKKQLVKRANCIFWTPSGRICRETSRGRTWKKEKRVKMPYTSMEGPGKM